MPHLNETFSSKTYFEKGEIYKLWLSNLWEGRALTFYITCRKPSCRDPLTPPELSNWVSLLISSVFWAMSGPIFSIGIYQRRKLSIKQLICQEVDIFFEQQRNPRAGRQLIIIRMLASLSTGGASSIWEYVRLSNSQNGGQRKRFV